MWISVYMQTFACVRLFIDLNCAEWSASLELGLFLLLVLFDGHFCYWYFRMDWAYELYNARITFTNIAKYDAPTNVACSFWDQFTERRVVLMISWTTLLGTISPLTHTHTHTYAHTLWCWSCRCVRNISIANEIKWNQSELYNAIA